MGNLFQLTARFKYEDAVF